MKHDVSFHFLEVEYNNEMFTRALLVQSERCIHVTHIKFKPLFSQSFHSKQHSSCIIIPRQLHRRSCLMPLQSLKGLELILILDFCCFHLTILIAIVFSVVAMSQCVVYICLVVSSS